MYTLALDRWFGDGNLWNDLGRSKMKRTNFKSGSDSENVFIELMCPGLDPASLKVEYFNNLLSITGQTAETKLSKPQKIEHKIEIYEDVDTRAIGAEYKNGILFITIAKPASVKPKLVEVKYS